MSGIIYHPKYSLYDLGPEHPFSPLRIEMLIDLIDSLGIKINFTEPNPIDYKDLFELKSSNLII